MKIEKLDSLSKTTFLLEEYIPLKIIFDTSFEEYHPSLEFVKNDSSLLELSVGNESHRLSSITLVVCEDYKIVDDKLPIFETIDGDIYIDEKMPDSLLHFETDVFETHVYLDGIVINLSNKPSTTFYKNNNVIWGIDETGEISQFIAEMDNEAVEHITNELNLQ